MLTLWKFIPRTPLVDAKNQLHKKLKEGYSRNIIGAGERNNTIVVYVRKGDVKVPKTFRGYKVVVEKIKL
jgi:hypothetical protein